jgi:excinuclease ABC subunit C
MIFAEQGELFPVLRAAGCLRHEIGTCLGPCAAACTRAAYAQHARAAKAFLTGADTAVLDTLRAEMKAAAAALAFERAQVLHATLEAFHGLREQLDRWRRARERFSCVYALRGHGGGVIWYLIREGLVVAAAPAPADRATARAVKTRIKTVFRPTEASAEPLAADLLSSLVLVASWFRRYPDQLAHTMDPRTALAVCRQVGV